MWLESVRTEWELTYVSITGNWTPVFFRLAVFKRVLSFMSTSHFYSRSNQAKKFKIKQLIYTWPVTKKTLASVSDQSRQPYPISWLRPRRLSICPPSPSLHPIVLISSYNHPHNCLITQPIMVYVRPERRTHQLITILALLKWEILRVFHSCTKWLIDALFASSSEPML